MSVLTSFRSGVVGTSIYSFDAPVRRQTFEITAPRAPSRSRSEAFDGPTRIPDEGQDDEEGAGYRRRALSDLAKGVSGGHRRCPKRPEEPRYGAEGEGDYGGDDATDGPDDIATARSMDVAPF